MNSDDRAILEQEDLGELVSHGAACPACGEGHYADWDGKSTKRPRKAKPKPVVDENPWRIVWKKGRPHLGKVQANGELGMYS
jgi:hypothetical protein